MLCNDEKFRDAIEYVNNPKIAKVKNCWEIAGANRVWESDTEFESLKIHVK